MSFPLPEPTPSTKPYWDELQAGRLVFARCRNCGHAWLPARSECPRCLSDGWTWETASGRGKIVSWVVYHHAYHEAFKAQLPYTVAVVELAEGPRLITNIVNPGDGIALDRPVVLKVENEEGFALARFALA